MSSKQETTTSIPEASAQEQRIRNALEQLGLGAGEAIDIEGLGGLASGQVSATPEDRALIEQSIQASRETAERAAQEQFQQLSQLVEAQALERGIQGSSIESVNQAILGRELQSQLGDITSRAQGLEAEQLLSLPFQRAGVQLSANQQLLGQLLGTTSPVLQSRLQERLVQPQQETRTTPGLGQILAGGVQSLGQGIGIGLGG